MVEYKIPPEDENRIVTQLIPDTTGKTCHFRTLPGLEKEAEYLPLVGWAIVIRVNPGDVPDVALEPVVDDLCHGPIALGDLEQETGELELLDIC
jgi:hypothetical protein